MGRFHGEIVMMNMSMFGNDATDADDEDLKVD